MAQTAGNNAVIPLSAVSLFCEDIRQEIGGTISLVGVLPDTMELPATPGALPKLAMYTRLHVAIDHDPMPLSVWLRMSGGPDQLLSEFDAALVEQTRKDAAAAKNPIAGFIAHAVASPFPVPGEGRIQIIVKSGDTECVSGSLLFKLA